MTQVHRIVGVFIVCLMLLASISGAAHAQSEGESEGTNTQQGGGTQAPPRNEPDPEPNRPDPDPAPRPTEPPSSGPNEGGGNSAPSTGQGGQQSPNQAKPKPAPPPSSNDGGGGNTGGGSGEFWILVDLSDRMMRAYRGDTVVLSSIVNIGKPGYETPTGTFYINSKIRYELMNTYGYLPDVPYTMYFTNRGHALHGTYWTEVNGRMVSHGCVGLPEGVAGQLFNMSSIGTRVVIRW